MPYQNWAGPCGPRACIIGSILECATRKYHAKGCCFGGMAVAGAMKCWGGLGCMVKISLTLGHLCVYCRDSVSCTPGSVPRLQAQWALLAWARMRECVLVSCIAALFSARGAQAPPVDCGVCWCMHSRRALPCPFSMLQHPSHTSIICTEIQHRRWLQEAVH